MKRATCSRVGDLQRAARKRSDRQSKLSSVRRRLNRLRPVGEMLEPRWLLASNVLDDSPLPLAFEYNAGQADPRVDYLARGKGYTVFLTPGEAVLSLTQSNNAGEEQSNGAALRVQLVGTQNLPRGIGQAELPSKSNYLLGSDPSQWMTGIAEFGQVKYAGVYAGIDQVFYGGDGRLQFDFIVSPGASVEDITLNFAGADQLALDGEGNLEISIAGGTVVQHAPIVYQEIGSVRQAVAGRYVLHGSTLAGFEVGAYDASHPLTIDPTLSYSTYLGGTGNDQGLAIAVDGAGDVYLTGLTASNPFPTTSGAFDATFSGTANDAFITKVNAAGTARIYSTYFGGNGDDQGLGIAVDASGRSFVTGLTTSTDLPLGSAFQSTLGGGQDVFAMLLNAAGSDLVFSTYLGGTLNDQGFGAAVDSAGNLLLTGFTNSSDFPTIAPLQAASGGANDAILARFEPTGTLLFSTYYGGNSTDQGRAIALDASDNAYITGFTDSNNFPLSAARFQSDQAFRDAFVAKISPANAMVYSTYVGADLTDQANAIDVDAAGNAYIVGITTSFSFPTANPIQGFLSIGNDAFVTKLDPSGTRLIYSTYLGGIADDQGRGIAVDSQGRATIVGHTQSRNFTTVNAIQGALANAPGAGVSDAFVTRLNALGNGMLYSTYLGGLGNDQAIAVAIDGSDDAYVAGLTASTNFPVAVPIQVANAGGNDVFVAKIMDDTIHPPVMPPVSNQAVATGNELRLSIPAQDPDSATVVVGPTMAYEIPAATAGNQAFTGSLGLDFDVAAPVRITQLGVFDDGSNGLTRQITARIFDRDNTATPLVTLVFPVGSGTLIGGSRFLPLSTPLDLSAGFRGTIEADGYGTGEQNGNTSVSGFGVINSGGGAIKLVGTARSSNTAGVFPTNIDGGPANRYAAGTFIFESQPTSVLTYSLEAAPTGAAINPATGVFTWTPQAGDPPLNAVTVRVAKTADSSLFATQTFSIYAGASQAGLFTVTNTADAGPGSLRQAVFNANAAAGTGTVMVSFNIPTTDPGYDPVTGVFTINIANPLPAITRVNVNIDGTTQTTNVGDTNPGQLGTGGTVGVDGLTLSRVNKPELQIVGGSGVPVGFDVAANNATIRGLAIYGFGNSAGAITQANISIRANRTGTLIESNVIGSGAAAFADPGVGQRTGRGGIYSDGGDSGTIRNNLIGFVAGAGVHLYVASNNWLIQNNEIRANGLENLTLDGILPSWGINNTISGNLITANQANGIEVNDRSQTIVNNTITANGFLVTGGSSTETAGIRLTWNQNTIDRNVITGNYGAGVLVLNGSSANTITRNSIFKNGATAASGVGPSGQLGIDLLNTTDQNQRGTIPFRSLNDAGDADFGGNNLVNAPVLTDARLQGGNLVVGGFVTSLVSPVAATYVGPPVLGEGGAPGLDVGNTSVRFGDTDTDYVVGTVNSFPTSALTVEFWVKTTATGGFMFSYATQGEDDEVYVATPSNLAIIVRNSGFTNTGVSVNDGNWHHVAVTWASSNGALRLYKDGALAFSGTLQTGTLLDPAGAIALGQDQDSVGGSFDPTQKFVGHLDEVAVFDTALSVAQVLAHYNAGTSYAASVLANNPHTYWRLNEAAGMTSLANLGIPAVSPASVEFFLTDGDPSGYGEGISFVASRVEGSVDDTDSGTGTYNIVNVGTDTARRFAFSIPIASLPPAVQSQLVDHAVLTATGTLSGSTSEFSRNIEVKTANAPPMITTTTVTPQVEAGGFATLTVNYTDADLLDGHTAAIDWGDGASTTIALAGGTTLLSDPVVFGGHTYYVTKSTMTRYAAETLAQSMGGYLATITNSVENRFIVDLIFGAQGTNQIAYIGLSDADEESIFRWTTGEPVTYTNWLSGNPSNSNGLEDYGEINNTTVGTWNDVAGTTARIAVIEVGPELTFTVKHQYGAPGSRMVTVTLSDNDATPLAATASAGLTVNNRAPQIATVTTPGVTIANPTPAASDQFGVSMAIVGNTLYVGAHLDDTGATNAGAVYAFDATTGTYLNRVIQKNLGGFTRTANDQFGFSLAAVGNKLLIGANLDDFGGTNTGAAYLYDPATNTLTRIANPFPGASDQFGQTVAAVGNDLVVSAILADDGVIADAGAAYVFDGATTTLKQVIRKPRLATADRGPGDKDGAVSGPVVRGVLNVGSVTLTNGGSNYTAVPTVVFSAPPEGGITATGTATILNGSVVAVTLTNPGTYVSPPTIRFVGGGGSGAAAIANIRAGLINDTDPAFHFVGGTVALEIPDLKTGTGTANMNSVSFWMNWTGAFGQMPTGFSSFDLFLQQTGTNPSFGFNTASSDLYGIALSGNVTGSTNAGPIVLTTSTNHGLASGSRVRVAGVLGNTAANGDWTVTALDNTHLSLDGSSGNGTYISGGTWTVLFGPNETPLANNWHFVSAAFSNSTPITGASNPAAPNPIVITSNNHGLATGDQVQITGVGGNTAANGAWTVTVIDENSFSLTGSTGNGAYTAGGTWMSNRLWIDGVQQTLATRFGNVSAVTITSGGTGYTSGPMVTFGAPPPGGIRATGTATIVNGALTAVVITNPGSGYTAAPSITISGGGGAGATATSTITAGGTTTARSIAYVVPGVSITHGGSGYTSAPTVTITSGSGATATANLGSGGAAGQVVSAAITAAGSNYTTPPIVTFSNPPAGGTTAAGVAVIENGQLMAVNITYPGSGYVTAPTITLTSVGSGATGVAIIDGSGQVTDVAITNVGSGYSVPPIVLFSGGGGSGAAGSAAVVTSARLSGWTNDATSRFTGALDEVAYFNRRLSTAEVQSQSAASSGTNYDTAILGQSPVAYYRLNETETGRLIGAGPSDQFGLSLSSQGSNKVLVGAPFDDGASQIGSNLGAVYVFDANTGARLQTIMNPRPTLTGHTQFGQSVTGAGDYIVVGAPLADYDGGDTGWVYIFDADTGALLRSLQNPNATTSDQFGLTLAAVGTDRVLVGAPFNDRGATNAGAAYLFDLAGGNIVAAFQRPTVAANDQFGFSVAAAGAQLAFGANLADISATDAGGAFVFQAKPATVTNVRVLGDLATVSGTFTDADAPVLLADSASQFSSLQGRDNWRYGYYSAPSSAASFTEFTLFDTASQIWEENATQPPWTLLSSDGGHPGGAPLSDTHWAVRRWISPAAGAVAIAGTLAKTNPNCGNGIVGRIYIDGVEVYSQAIAFNDLTGLSYEINALLNAGSTVDFIIDGNGETFCDGSRFSATISAPSQTQSHTVQVDWGDGNIDTVPVPPSSRAPIGRFSMPYSFQGHIYYAIEAGNLTHAQAQARAASLGGRLVTINSLAENQFVTELIRREFNSDAGAWIGISDAAVEGTFAWGSGELVFFTRWAAGQPGNSAGIDGAAINQGGVGNWTTFGGTQLFSAAIVEIDGRRSFSASHDYASDGEYTATIEVTDSAGGTDTETVIVTAGRYTVSSTSDSGPGSLRQAILNANAHPGPDTIVFDIPGFGVRTIPLLSALPTITDTIIIDGYSQSGASPNTLAIGNNAVLLVELNGTGAGTGSSGLTITAANSVVQGLVINRFNAHGILLSGAGATGNVIAGNFMGTNATGTAALANASRGVAVWNGANSNLIGGATPAARNLISGNSLDGISVSNAGTSGNRIQGNYIGTNAGGTAKLANGDDGIEVLSGAASNYVGTDGDGENDATEGNLVSGNNNSNVGFFGALTNNNVVAGNLLGTDAAGTAALGAVNRGVFLGGMASNNRIGTNGDGISDELERNVLSGNSQDGVLITDAGTSGNIIAGNYIGTSLDGLSAIANLVHGIRIQSGAASNRIGTNADGVSDLLERNVISGNGAAGMRISGSGTNSNVIAGNYIGTNSLGDAALGNGAAGGVRIDTGAQFNRVGTNADGIEDEAERNVIAGSTNADGQGVRIDGVDASFNVVAGNYIGTNAAGAAALPNTSHGVAIRAGATNNTIGGAIPAAGNVIVGNLAGGVTVSDSTSTGNTIRLNSISANGGLGIDLGADGVTLNDPGDDDSGPNNLLNFPVFTSILVRENQLIITGQARTGATIDLYLADPDPSGYGEGKAYLGTFIEGSIDDNDPGPPADGEATSPFRFAFLLPAGVSPGEAVTATATLGGDTSEFSLNTTVQEMLVYASPLGDSLDALVRLAGLVVELLDNGDVVRSQLLTLTAGVVVNGSNVNDALSVDFSAGFFSLAEGISFLGGLGEDTLTINATAGDDTIAVTSTAVTVNGSATFYSSVEQVLVNALGGIDSSTVTSLSAKTTIDGGPQPLPAMDTTVGTFAGHFDGELTLLRMESTSVTVAGDFSGRLLVPEEVPSTGTGVIDLLTVVGNVTSTAYIAAATIVSTQIAGSVQSGAVILATGDAEVGTFIVEGDFEGELIVADLDANGNPIPDTGTIGTLVIGSDNSLEIESLNGTVTTGTLSDITVNGNMDGEIHVGALESGTIDGDMNGLIEATGFGTIDYLEIGGDLTGDVTAPEDTLPDGSPDLTTGIIGEIIIEGSVTETGSITTGNLESGTIDGDMNGLIEATGAGTIGYLEIGGDLGGDVSAPEDTLPDGSPDLTTGIIGEIIIEGSVMEEGSITTGNLESGTIDGDMNGLIEATGAGVIGNLVIGRSLGLTGLVRAVADQLPGSGSIGTLSVGASFPESVVAGIVLANSLSNMQLQTLSGEVTITEPIDTATVATISRGARDNFTVRGEIGPTNENSPLTEQLFSGLTLVAFDSTSALGAVVQHLGNGVFSYDPTIALNRLGQDEKALDSFTVTTRIGEDGPETITTVTVRVTGINDPPTAHPDPVTIDEDSVLAVSPPGILINDTDPDASDVLVISQLNGSASAVGIEQTLDSGATLIVNFDGGYTYASGGVFNHLAEGQTDTDGFTYQASDGFGGADTAAVAITIAGVNDAPLLAAGTTPFGTITEDDTTNSGETVATLVGSRISDVDSGAVQGIAVTSTASGNGIWQFFLDGGTVWQEVGTISTSQALLLRPQDRLRFVPDAKNGTSASVTYRAWDQTGATNNLQGQKVSALVAGGSTAFSIGSNSSEIVVMDVNDDPVAASDSGSATEAGGVNNTTPGASATGNVLDNDTDVDLGDTKTVVGVLFGGVPGTVGSALAGNYGTLTLGANGNYVYTVNNLHSAVEALQLGQSLSETFEYQVADSADATDEALFVITIHGANDAPTISRHTAAVIVNEGATAVNTGDFADVDLDEVVALSASVGTVDLLDAGSGAWSWSYAATDGPQQSQTVMITATDSQGATATTSFLLTVNNAASTLSSLAAMSITENGVTTLTGRITDPGTNDTFTLVVNWGDPLSPNNVETYLFNASPTGSQAFSIQHRYLDDNPSGTSSDSYTIALTVTDKDGATGSGTTSVLVSNAAPSATIIGAPTSSTEGTPIGLAADVSDFGTLDTFTYAWSVQKNGLPYAAGSAASVTLTPNDNGNYSVTLTVTDDDGAVGTATASITVENADPLVNAGADQTAREGSAIAFAGSFTDAGSGDTHTIHWNFGDGGTASSTLTPTHVYADNGLYTVTLTVTDDDGGTSSDTLTVNVGNLAPSVTINGSGSPGSQFTSTVFDPGPTDNSSPFTYAWLVAKQNDPQFQLTGSAASLLFTPSGDGTYFVNLSVTDKDGGTGADTRTIQVSGSIPIPHIQNAPANSAEGSLIQLGAAATQGTAPYSFAWSIAKNGSPFASGSAASFNFTPDDNGVYTVSLVATDSLGASATDRRTVVVTNAPPSPTINGAPESSAEGTLIALTSTISDPGTADSHTYGWSVTKNGTPYAAGINPAFSFTPNDNGTYVVTLVATDDDGATGGDTRTIHATNGAPQVNASGDQTADEGSLVSFAGSFTDAGGADTHTILWSFGDGASAAGTLTPTHVYAEDGTYTVTLTLTDDDGEWSSNSLTVTVSNVAPTATILGAPTTSREGTTINLSGTASDVGILDTNTFAWTVTKGGVAFASGSGPAFNFTPDDDGSYAVTLTATDDDGRSGSDTQTIVVTNAAPLAAIEGAPATSPEGTSITLTATVFDLGLADSFSYAWSVLKQGAHFTSGNGVSFTFTPDNNDTYAVSLLVTDDDGGTGPAAATIIVENAAPTVMVGGAPTATEGQTRHYTFTTSDPGADAFTIVASSGGTAGVVTNLVFNATSGAGSFDVTFQDGPTSSTVNVQVKDSDNALSNIATVTVSVNNALPTVALSGPNTAFEGETLHYTFTTTDPGLDTFQIAAASGGAVGTVSNLTIDPLTGAGSFDVTFLAGPASSAVSIQVQDSDFALSNAAFINVAVANAPPSATIVGPDTAPEGTVVSLISLVSDPGSLDTFSYQWSVTKVGLLPPYASGASAGFSFTPDDSGAFLVTLTVTDNGGASRSTTKTIDVANVAPTGTLSPGGFIFEGNSASVSFTSATDHSTVDAASLKYFFSTDIAARNTSQYSTAASTPAAALPFFDNGSYTVYARLLDKDGSHNDYQTTVTVRNIAPTFSPPASQQGIQGIAGSFNLGGFVDPGADSPWTVLVDWGDSSLLTIFQATATGGLGSQPHAYAATGSYNVAVTVVDKDGESRSGSFAISVIPPAPTLTPPPDQTAQEGVNTHFSLGSFQDLAPPPADGWTGLIDWGDGTHNTITVNTVGTLPEHAHTYADNGVYTVTVQLTGVAGLPGQTSFMVMVDNVAPEIAGLGNSSPEGSNVLPGQRVTINASFMDPGTADTHSALIDWGDGSTSAGTVVESGGAGNVTGSHAYATGGIYVVRLTLIDDEGESAIDVTTSIIAGVGLHNRQLQIIGTTGRDIAVVPRLGDTLLVFTLLGLPSSPTDDANCGENHDEDWSSYFLYYALATFKAADVDSILIKGYGGHDHIYVSQGVNQSAIIDGGQGNDWLHGGGGPDIITDLSGDNRVFGGGGNDTINTGAGTDTINAGSGNDIVSAGGGRDYAVAGTGSDTVDAGEGHDIVVGGDGSDTLRGGTGRDLIIGGNGADLILGNGDEDILIAGTTDYDANETALLAIMDEWTSDRTYLQRIHNLSQGTAEKGALDSSTFNNRSNKNYYLIGNDGGKQTVFNDNEVDTLTGEIDSSDWFLANKTADNGGAIDIITDKALGEIYSDTDF